MISHSALVIGPQGSGKSHFANSVLKYYGSGVVVMARGDDEKNSYYPLFEDTEHYDFRGFDDPDFQPVLGERSASGAIELVRWLSDVYKRLKVEYDANGSVLSRRVVVFDTATGIGQLAMNATLSKFGLTEPPPVRGERGYPFFSYLSKVQEGIFAKGRALRGLGLHWIVLAQAADREVTPGQATPNEGMLKTQVMAAVPGGFRDVVGQYFDNVFQMQAVTVAGKEPVRQMLWLPDPRRNTKSRLGSLRKDLKPVPNEWPQVLTMLNELIKIREVSTVVPLSNVGVTK